MGWPQGGKIPVACITESVTVVMAKIASSPASTAPTCRSVRRGRRVSVMTLMLWMPPAGSGFRGIGASRERPYAMKAARIPTSRGIRAEAMPM